MRLIDADALKKEYRMADRCEDCVRNSRDCQNDYSWTLMDVCSMLDDAPTVGGWISVKDHPPKKDEDVIIYGKYIGVSGTAYPEMLITDIDEFVHSGFVPIAWMPLPEPPEVNADA